VVIGAAAKIKQNLWGMRDYCLVHPLYIVNCRYSHSMAADIQCCSTKLFFIFILFHAMLLLSSNIGAVMLVWRLGGKIIRAVQCCVMCDSCAQ